MNRITRAFLSGASLAALSVVAPMAARAAEITSSLPAHAAITVSHAQKHDFILITHTGAINGAFSVGAGDALINHDALPAVPFAMLTVTNPSTIFISAIATASNPGGLAIASASTPGFVQATTSAGSAIDKFSNTNAAHFSVHANAAALGATASADAHLVGLSQFALAGNTAFASMHNSGLADFEAHAHATATLATAHAHAKAFGVHQEANATNPAGHATAEFVNTGSFVVKAQATAHGANTAIAIATATGVDQEANNSAGHAKAEFVNTASFQVHAQATAGGANNNTANACANGVMQNLPGGGTASASNAGVFQVSATAVAANAGGCAKGLVQSGPNLAVNDINKASFSINAHLNDASASAAGIELIAGSGGKVSGTIENDSVMHVSAVAVGGPAIAKGIEVLADQFSGTIVNKGTLHVFAKGTTASATAIVIDNEGNPSGIGTGKIVNDGGTISAGISNGAATLRGTAINVSGAPNAVGIDLEGENQAGNIYGNVILSPDNNDTINVINGVTFFNGGINPAGNFYGALNVGGGASPGTLNLVDDAFEGQSYANVDTYHQFANGILVVNIGANTIPGFVFIHANNATLGGTLVLNLAPGLYADTIPFTVVLSVSPVSGNWADIAIANNSMFFRPVQGGQPSDIELQRIPFDDTGATPSLIKHPNEEAVADGLEHSYSTSLTGPYASLITALLFLPNNEVEYQHILDELSGEEAGEVAWANVMASEVLKDAVAAHLQATMGAGTMMSQLPSSIAPAAGSAMSKGAIWGGAYGKRNQADTLVPGPDHTYEAPGFNSSEHGFIAGGDMPVDPNTTVGIGGAWTAHGSLNFSNNNSGRFDGFEVGAYARYDDPQSAFYLQGLASYGWYSDQTRRFVSVPGFGSGWVKGSYDSHVWQLYGEGGIHVDTGSSMDLVPYVALDYLNGDSNAYNETGLPGADLHVSNAKATSFSSYMGAKVSFLNMGMAGGTNLVPTLKLAWQHQFDSNIWEVNASFIGGPNSNFTVTGAGLSKDSLVAGAEVAMTFSDNVDAVLDYEGRFASNNQSNTIIGRLNFKF